MLKECCGNCKHSQKRDESDIKENRYRLYHLKCLRENPLYVNQDEHCLLWELKGENNEGKRICRNCKNFYEYDSVFDEEDNEDYFTLFCKVKGEVREPDEEIADKCKDFVLKGENND